MGRLGHSWQMMKTSFRVVGQDKELLWMPILSFLATAIVIMSIVGIGWAADVIPSFQNEDGSANVPGILLAAVFYIVLAFIQVFFHAATVAGARQRLTGGDPTVGSALGAASKCIGRLFVWALVVATVNVILQALRQAARRNAGILDDIVVGIAGGAWNLATYFVVPILLFEERGVGGGLKGSAALFKRTWGQNILGQVGFGVLTFLLILAVIVCAAVVGIPLAMLHPMAGLVGVAVLVVGIIGVLIATTVASAVYKTALYLYASKGQEVGPFTHDQLAGAYATR